jgi:hydroxymethylpyrimidine pyrophosphatase-like HAD family hydrolase
LDIPRTKVMAVGDGRNDIDMLEWAGSEGRAVAMGQAPDEVRSVSTERTATDVNDGVAHVLATFLN